jgi:hypothetical protein
MPEAGVAGHRVGTTLSRYAHTKVPTTVSTARHGRRSSITLRRSTKYGYNGIASLGDSSCHADRHAASAVRDS